MPLKEDKSSRNNPGAKAEPAKVEDKGAGGDSKPTPNLAENLPDNQPNLPDDLKTEEGHNLPLTDGEAPEFLDLSDEGLPEGVNYTPETPNLADSSETPFQSAESYTTGKGYVVTGSHPAIDPMTGQIMSQDELNRLNDEREGK